MNHRQPSGGGSLQPQTHVYTYDGVERVTGATTYPNATPTGTPIRTFAYAYDLAGNRTSAALNGTPTSYSYNNRNQLTGDGTHTFSYDKNGNRISDGTLSTVWDRAGQMLSHDGHSYAYDGEGRRIVQSAAGSTTRYVLDVQRGLPAVIGAKAGSDVTHYMHGPLGMFAQHNPDSSWDWMLHDGLGSVRGVFDGTLQSAAEYDPFGEPIVAPVGTAYGFTGELTDGNGMVYLRARYLAPGLGTLASRDSWRGSASAPRTWNSYAWVEGNVINRVDPGGMQSAGSSCQQIKTPSAADILDSCYDECMLSGLMGDAVRVNCEAQCAREHPGARHEIVLAPFTEHIEAASDRWHGLFADSFGEFLSADEYATAVAGVVLNEFPETPGDELRELTGDLMHVLLGSDRSLGPGNLRPSVVDEIFGEFCGTNSNPETPELCKLKAEWEALGSDKRQFLSRPDVAVELVAANLYRGAVRVFDLRSEVHGLAPTVFNLMTWHNKGIVNPADLASRTNISYEARLYASQVGVYVYEMQESSLPWVSGGFNWSNFARAEERILLLESTQHLLWPGTP